MRGPAVAAVAVVAAVAALLSAQLAGAAAARRSGSGGGGSGVGGDAGDLQVSDAAMAGLLGSQEVQYPNRPNMFKSPVELRQYLNALDAYYAIAGRPRFGKRGMRGASQPRQMFSSDLYDY
ncbi:uncharacterized protein LOC122252720 [Penaeus japonicus]|uniref:uncharacterized protein LOC122252720 n=1 Tax=Penaeus japonicus TaxID=27405 RepID=UPI001C70D3F2|nr:uncharacterized protein LOC122252720 [Penaeus japonicus]